MSEDGLDAEELPCSSQLVPLAGFPFTDGMQTSSSDEPQTFKDECPVGEGPDQQSHLRQPAQHLRAPGQSSLGRSQHQADDINGASGRPKGGSSPRQSPVYQLHADGSEAAWPAKLPPLKHILAAPHVITADAQVDSAAQPAQRLRPTSALQLEARLAAAQQDGAAPLQQARSGVAPHDNTVRTPRSASTAANQPPPSSVSPAGMNVHKLMAAARAARQLEAEVQRLEAERHSLQGRLAAEAAEHQRCSAALDDAHIAHNRMADKMEQLHGLLQIAQAEHQRSSAEGQEGRATNARLNAELQQLQDRLQTGSGMQQQTAAELQELRSSNESLRQQLQEVRAVQQAAASEAADMRMASAAAEAEISRLNKAGKGLCTEMNAMQEQLTASRGDVQAAHMKLEAEVRRAHEAQAEADDAANTVQRSQQELAFARQRADEAAQHGQGLHSAAGQLRDENGRLASQLAHLRAQLDHATSELNTKSAEAAGLARHLTEAEAAADAATRESAAARRRLADLERHAATLQAQAAAAQEEAADLRARCRRLERASYSGMDASPAGSGASSGPPPPPLAAALAVQPMYSSSGKSAQHLAAPATPSPHEIGRRSFRDSGDDSQYNLPPQHADASRPLTPEARHHHEGMVPQQPQLEYQRPVQQQPGSYEVPQGSRRQRPTTDYPPSPPQQRQLQPVHQLRTPPQQSVAASPARAEAEEFFMQRGARRAAVEGSSDSDRPGSRPFGTEQSLEELMQQTKEHEDALMRLMLERNELSCEYAKMPAHGGRTLADRRRKAHLEARLESIDRSASALRLHLKRLGAA